MLGNALETYDFMVYGFFAVQIGHAFFPAAHDYASLMLSLATFGAGFVTRPLGALVIGTLADRTGRKPAMILCLALMGASIIGLALVPPYAAIGLWAPMLAVAARMVQGFSMGGEIGANSAFLLEAASPERRGVVISFQAISQSLASVTAGIIGIGLTQALSPAAFDAWGWRAALLFGGLALPVGLWLRRGLPETLHRREAEAEAADATGGRLATARRNWRAILFGLMLVGSGTITTYGFAYIPTYAQSALHMRAGSGFTSQVLSAAAGIPLLFCGAWISDRVGRRPLVIWTKAAALLAIAPAFYWVVSTRSEAALIVGPLLVSAIGAFGGGALWAALAEGFPKSIRGSGLAVVYAMAVAVLGGTTQLVVTWLIHATGNPMALAAYLSAAAALGLLAGLLMPERAPARLRAVALSVPVAAPEPA